MSDNERIVIVAKDIARIKGCSIATAHRILRNMRITLDKPKPAFITIEDFSAYSKIKERKVMQLLGYDLTKSSILYS